MLRCKLIILIFLFPIITFGQAAAPPVKVINQQMQTWVSINTLTKFSNHWGIVADAHVRSNDIFKDNNFYFLRGGVSYIPNAVLSVVGGYAHMWLAPTNPDWDTYSNENRIYQQMQFNSKLGNVSVLQRIRNEQRWQEKIADDMPTGEIRFTNRVRYLLSFNIPVFTSKKAPSLVLSDEVLVQFGQEVVYNTFDQNRLFIGIKQTINPKLSFDFGYMNVYQQKYSGYEYDMNHTLRLFFYLNSTIKKATATDNFNSGDE